ncbi:hypothetical protein BDN70DRAFT_990310 [Pholiota conissans]|uniref:HIT-type domain-containing protein n=1 Tax=Pholiota conissans TaxID=109636 RepID=A0A9P5Z9J7_9AGAR|nr:hypothetical protein BDN70DRAFT_990310 [Pholiota conissans]
MYDNDARTQDTCVVTRLHTMPRPSRTRTSSLLSVSSGISLRSVFEISKSRSTSGISLLPLKHEAYGSFIPARSATSTLQDFASYVSPPITRTMKRRRRVTFDDKCSHTSSWRDDNDSSSSTSSTVPYITRTPYSSLFSPPSPASTSSSLSPPLSPLPSPTEELHPILATLEKKSRFCTQRVQCSTCRKEGSDFPRCPKCGDMWCSRPCRLVNGKRHTCSSSRQ